MDAEKPENLIQPGDLEDGDWYRLIFDKVLSTPEDFENNREMVSFITFNYDRSLEHSLHRVCLDRFGNGYTSAAELVQKIPVVHVHGTLGFLPWQAKNIPETIDYATNGEKLSPHVVQATSQYLRIGFEETGDNLKKAHSLLENAEKVIFLGFRYAQSNLDEIASKECEAAIYGTVYGMLSDEIDELKGIVSKSFPRCRIPDSSFGDGIKGLNCSEFLSSNSILDT
ncbi:SIR2 family protein [Candidatus Hydrogenedentota bacterium]